MKYYSLLHSHRHGTTTYLFKTKRSDREMFEVTQNMFEELISLLQIDFEPDSNEWIEINEIDIADIKELV